jgi:hypothetical protein
MSAVHSLNSDPRSTTEALQEKLSSVYTRAESSANLTVLTKEGDRVTLSTHSLVESIQAQYGYEHLSPHRRTSASGEAQASTAEQSFEVTVEGDLNEQEQADVKRLMNHVRSIVKKFLSGDLEGTERKLGKLNHLGTLAGFSLDAVRSETVVTTQQTQQSTRPAQEPVPNEAPPPRSLTALTQHILDILKHSGLQTEQLPAPLSTLITQVLKELTQERPGTATPDQSTTQSQPNDPPHPAAPTTQLNLIV